MQSAPGLANTKIMQSVPPRALMPRTRCGWWTSSSTPPSTAAHSRSCPSSTNIPGNASAGSSSGPSPPTPSSTKLVVVVVVVVVAGCGYPVVLRCDNGPELACDAMADWAGEGLAWSSSTRRTVEERIPRIEAACRAFMTTVNGRLHRTHEMGPGRHAGTGTGPVAPGPGASRATVTSGSTRASGGTRPVQTMHLSSPTSGDERRLTSIRCQGRSLEMSAAETFRTNPK